MGHVDGYRVLFFDGFPPVPLPQAREPSFGGHISRGGRDVSSGPTGGASVLPSPAGDSGELFIL